MMKAQGIEIIDNLVNSPVVQLEGRCFPGVVIQGDSLFSLFNAAERLFESVSKIEGKISVDDAEFIRDSLGEYLLAYESVLEKKGMELPYVKK